MQHDLTLKRYRARLAAGNPFRAASPTNATTVEYDEASPLIGCALHHSHHMRPELGPHLVIAPGDRYYDEDPETHRFLSVLTHRILPNQSRYEVDLNRSPDVAVYARPELAWGIQVYDGELDRDTRERSLEKWCEYHAAVDAAVEDAIDRFGRAYVLDIHSYNYQREGPVDWRTDGKPVINLGTAYLDLDDEGRSVKDWLLGELQGHTLLGEQILVEENTAFKGGYLNRRLARQYGPRCITLSVEYKKVFMDEREARILEHALADLVGQFNTTIRALAERLDAPVLDEPRVPEAATGSVPAPSTKS